MGIDGGQRGWRTHAVRGNLKTRFSEIRKARSACGLQPRHGWGMDLWVERRCVKCERKMSRDEIETSV